MPKALSTVKKVVFSVSGSNWETLCLLILKEKSNLYCVAFGQCTLPSGGQEDLAKVTTWTVIILFSALSENHHVTNGCADTLSRACSAIAVPFSDLIQHRSSSSTTSELLSLLLRNSSNQLRQGMCTTNLVKSPLGSSKGHRAHPSVILHMGSVRHFPQCPVFAWMKRQHPL